MRKEKAVLETIFLFIYSGGYLPTCSRIFKKMDVAIVECGVSRSDTRCLLAREALERVKHSVFEKAK